MRSNFRKGKEKKKLRTHHALLLLPFYLEQFSRHDSERWRPREKNS
jgi:hypothetical protein